MSELAQLQAQYLQEGLAFLDQQRLMVPSVNEQIRFDFQGLRRSYRDDPNHPDARLIARFGRIWIYDVALSIYADLKTKRFRQAGYQVGRAIQLARQERERGFQGLWHFSYNTQGDAFIDSRGPTGANAWCLNAVYAFILATGDTATLSWANQVVQEYLFAQQVMDVGDPRYGLIRAGLHNAEDVARGDAFGYRVYEGDPNCPYQHLILEHNADVAGTFRLAFRAVKRFLPQEGRLLEELIHRHDLLMQAIHHSFWQGDHFVSAMQADGALFTGTDGFPSVAVDNNTWAAHLFLPYDRELARLAIRYVEERFITQAPPAHLEDLPSGEAGFEAGKVRQDLQGLYYFPATFQDPFVLVAAEDRSKMEKTLQPEAAFGFILFLKAAAQSTPDPSERSRLVRRADELYEETLRLIQQYGPSGAPYASANVPAVFSTLHSVTTAATGVITTAILQGAPADDFIGVIPPPEFTVGGHNT